MRGPWFPVRWRVVPLAGVSLLVGCTTSELTLPGGYYPPPLTAIDQHADAALLPPTTPSSFALPEAPEAPVPPPKKDGAFQLPPSLQGPALLKPLELPKDATPAEREKVVRAAYPVLPSATGTFSDFGNRVVTLQELQEQALSHSPSVRKAEAEAAAALGQVQQAGLHPNPTVGYQADQVQPGVKLPAGTLGTGSGQQGAFLNLLIKTAGKLTLAQQVAGYDYVNALVAVRKARLDVVNQVRTNYFALVVAKQSMETNQALAQLADGIYELQLKQVIAGEAAGYEPLQLYAQAVQARSALKQADNTYRSAWRQLAATLNQPNMPIADVAGSAKRAVPTFQEDKLKQRLLDEHTDLLTARNTLAQAQANLTLQQRLPIPDLQTNQYHQYDNLARTYQFGVQIGFSIPVFDRNQGNIRTAQAQIVASHERLTSTQNDLLSRFAAAYAKYETNRVLVSNSQEKVLPSLTQAYQGLIRRYNVEPDKVSFNDIVTAQQNLATALQAYLTALDGVWQAVVELSNLSQLDDLFSTR